jgi:hypothetical protein
MPDPNTAPAPDGPAGLDIPEDRRRANAAQAAGISATVRKVATTLPLGADVDDFRRVLVAEAPK